MKSFILIAAAAALVAGCGARHDTAWMMGHAEDVVRTRCTNDVIGFTRIIDVQVDFSPHGDTNGIVAEPEGWRAQAVVEHINPAGGIERTNLPYHFLVYEGHLIPLFDDHPFRAATR